MQVLAVGNAAITPGGTTAATGSPVTRSGLSSPGLAAEWRLPGLAGLVGLTGSVALGVLAQRLRCHPPSWEAPCPAPARCRPTPHPLAHALAGARHQGRLAFDARQLVLDRRRHLPRCPILSPRGSPVRSSDDDDNTPCLGPSRPVGERRHLGAERRPTRRRACPPPLERCIERPECPEGVQKMSRRCPEDVQKVSRRLEKNVGTSRGSSAGVQKASGVLPKVSLSQVKP